MKRTAAIVTEEEVFRYPANAGPDYENLRAFGVSIR